MVPPNFPQGEQAVLAACMLDGDCIPRVRAVLTPRDFYESNNATIFETICQLDDRKKPVDLVTVTEMLYRYGRLDEVGGQAVLVDLIDAAPSTANVMHYVQVVKEKAILRSIARNLSGVVESCYKEGAEAQVIQDELQKLTFDLVSKSTTSRHLKPVKDVVLNSVDRIEHARDRGLPSGFLSIDGFTKGFRTGELVIIGGRPSMGKSSLATDMAIAATKRTAVAIFSLEMSEDELTTRLISKSSSVDLHRLRAGYVGEFDWPRITDAIGEIAEYPLFIDDSGSITPTQIKSRVQEVTVRTGLEIGMVVVDYLQLMSTERKHNSLNERVSELTRSLKILAKDLKTRVICLSQLNRQIEQRPFKGHERRPRMSDYRDSGSVEQDADIMIGLYRPEVYSDDEQYRGFAEAVILKQRNGPTGIAPLKWYPTTATFTDPPQTEPQEASGDSGTRYRNWQDKDDELQPKMEEF